jgi:N-methylhydantoinase B
MNELARPLQPAGTQSTKAVDRGINPITAEVIRHGLISIPNQIDVNITRTAFSPLIYEYKDYAVGIVDSQGRLICQATGGIPIFVANALGVAVRDGIEVHGLDGIEPGDVIISNHAATLGQHLNNVVMYTPVFSDSRLFGFMCVLVHWIDVGGAVPGSCLSTTTTDIFQEGIQFRSVKLWSRGKLVKDIYGIIEVNTRFPHMARGDLESQLAGCMLGKGKLEELLQKYQMDDVLKSIELMWDRSESAARAAIRAIPDGVYEASSFLDNDGIDLTKNIPIKIVIRVEGDEMTIDFSGIADQLNGPLNSGRDGGAVTAARIAFKYIAAPNEPANDGSFRPVHVAIPDGKFLSAGRNAALGMYSSTLPTVVDTILKAMVPVVPDRLAAAHHGTMGIHAFDGANPKTGQLFQNLETIHGGWGASNRRDGPGPFKTINHGDTRDVPVEAVEALYPLRIDYIRFRPDSGGPGRFRGGLGIEKATVALAPCKVRTSIERTQCPAWGAVGGGAGKSPASFIERLHEPPKSILKGEYDLRAGDVVHAYSGGGGGFGNPFEREPSTVATDVKRGYISREAARSEYAVSIGDNFQVDEVETRALRADKRSATPTS